jgi:hypothetical protein
MRISNARCYVPVYCSSFARFETHTVVFAENQFARSVSKYGEQDVYTYPGSGRAWRYWPTEGASV